MKELIEVELIRAANKVADALEKTEISDDELVDGIDQNVKSIKLTGDYIQDLKLFKEQLGEDYTLIVGSPNFKEMFDEWRKSSAQNYCEECAEYLQKMLADKGEYLEKNTVMKFFLSATLI